jgi:drug/metabolite transporter (DMT)-like permease
MSGPHVGELAALFTALLWTLSALAWTAAGKHVGALAVSFIRLIIACGLLIVYWRAVRGLWLPSDADLRTWLVLGASGILGFFLSDLCLLKAFLLIGPRLSLLIGALTPPMAAVLSWVWIHDRLDWWNWLAMSVTLAGVAWVVLEQPSAEDHPHARHRARGIMLALLSAAMMAFGYVLSKEGLGDYDAVGATLIRVLVALPGYALLVTLWRRWPGILSTMRNGRVIAIVTFGAIVGPFVGVVFSMIALRYAPTGVVATIIATTPVLILPFSILLHHERVSLRAVGGAIIAVAGVALLMLQRR